jgi:tight adherence protein B
MTTLGWLALGLAALLVTGPAVVPARADELAARRRLATAPGAEAGHAMASVRRAVAPAVAGTVLMIAWALGPALGVAAGAVALCAWGLARDAGRRRSAAARDADLLAAVRVLVAELEAGTRPAAALGAAADVAAAHRPALQAAAAEATAGGDAGALLAADPATRALGLAWQLGHDAGTALADVLARVAADLAAAAEQRRAVGVALSGPRASAAVLTGLPVLGLVMGTAMGARPVAFLLESSAGRLVAGAGVLLDVAGVWWMWRILRAASAV